jgi:hypothetical protein
VIGSSTATETKPQFGAQLGQRAAIRSRITSKYGTWETKSDGKVLVHFVFCLLFSFYKKKEALFFFFYEARFPDYPNSTASTGAASGPEYAKILKALIPPLRAVDPSLTLVAVEVDAEWNAAWINTSVAQYVSATSAHVGYANSDAGGSPASAASATAQAKLPHTTVPNALCHGVMWCGATAQV